MARRQSSSSLLTSRHAHMIEMVRSRQHSVNARTALSHFLIAAAFILRDITGVDVRIVRWSAVRGESAPGHIGSNNTKHRQQTRASATTGITRHPPKSNSTIQCGSAHLCVCSCMWRWRLRKQPCVYTRLRVITVHWFQMRALPEAHHPPPPHQAKAAFLQLRCHTPPTTALMVRSVCTSDHEAAHAYDTRTSVRSC